MPISSPRDPIKKVSVGAGGDVHGVKIAGNAKSAQNTRTQFQNIFERDAPKAAEEVRSMGGKLADFPGFEFKTIYTDDGGEFKGVCHDYLEDDQKIHHVVFAPDTGTKRRLGVVERFNRTFREKYELFTRTHTSKYFNVAIPDILEDYNFIDDHKSIKQFITRKQKKGSHYFNTEARKEAAKAPVYMLEPGREAQFVAWKAKETKQVDEIQKDRIQALRKTDQVKYFRGLFHSKRRGKKGEARPIDMEDQFLKSGRGNLMGPVKLLGKHKYNVRGSNTRKNVVGKSYTLQLDGDRTNRLLPYDLIPFK